MKQLFLTDIKLFLLVEFTPSFMLLMSFFRFIWTILGFGAVACTETILRGNKRPKLIHNRLLWGLRHWKSDIKYLKSLPFYRPNVLKNISKLVKQNDCWEQFPVLEQSFFLRPRWNVVFGVLVFVDFWKTKL